MHVIVVVLFSLLDCPGLGVTVSHGGLLLGGLAIDPRCAQQNILVCSPLQGGCIKW